MRAEDVPWAWMEAADRVLMPGKPMTTSDLRTAFAAVAPLIAAQERERCARLAAERADDMYEIAAAAQDEGDQDRCERMTYRGNGAKSVAAAIRAMGDADE